MKTIALVPIKLRNTRLLNKNLLSLSEGSDNLIQILVNKLVKIEEIDEVYVYCSDESIIDFLPNCGIFLKRPKSLDTDETTMNDILNSFAQEKKSDVYVLCHATSPFITVTKIKECIKNVVEEKYDSSFTVTKIQEFLWTDSKPLNYCLYDIPRTQDLPPLFSETSGAYVFKADVLHSLNQRIGINPKLVEVDAIEAIDIDNEIDFILAKTLNSVQVSNNE